MKKSLILSTLLAFNAFALTVDDIMKMEMSSTGKFKSEVEGKVHCAEELARTIVNQQLNGRLQFNRSTLNKKEVMRNWERFSVEDFEATGEINGQNISINYLVKSGVFNSDKKDQMTIKCKISKAPLDIEMSEKDYKYNFWSASLITECSKNIFFRTLTTYPNNDIHEIFSSACRETTSSRY